MTTDLGVLPGDEDSSATAINGDGMIVGSSGRTDPVTDEMSYRPLVSTNRVMTVIPAPSVEATRRTSMMLEPGDQHQRCGGERRSEWTTAFAFTVQLSVATTSTVRVNFSTADGSAASGLDYTGASGTLVFSPGETTKTVVVAVNGDRTREPDETSR